MNQHPDNESLSSNNETPTRASRSDIGNAVSEQERNEKRTALPQDVRNLIVRRLEHKCGLQWQLWIDMIDWIYSKLTIGMLDNVSLRQTGRASIPTAIQVYLELVSTARAVTSEWPGAVWETMRSTLQNVNLVAVNASELNAIVDEFSWPLEGDPFTLDFTAPAPFLLRTTEIEGHYYGGMRSDTYAEFMRLLVEEAPKAKCRIHTLARAARDNVGIAIDDYVIAAEQLSRARTPSTRHTKKQSTLATDANPNDPPVGSAEWRRSIARTAANARHSQRGGSHDKQQRMRELWATGKYSSREICAEQECAALGMSFSAARKALRNTPKPAKHLASA